MFTNNFLPKEAKFGLPKSITHGTVKSMDALKEKVSPMAEFYDSKKIQDMARENIRNDGNGLVGDVGIGALGFLPRKGKDIKEAVVNKMTDFKQGVQRIDQATSQKAKDAVKIKEGSLLDRFTSVKNRREVGINPLRGGTTETLEGVTNRSSWLAPVQNTAKVTAPFLGTMYVADKMYPQEEQVANELNDYHDKNGFEDALLTERLDKKAALDKVAYLEDEIEKLASHVEELKEESNLLWKQAETERIEKERIVMEKTAFENEMMEKISSYDEFKARTNIRERSKSAVKVAEDLLEHGIIKQAEFDKKVDFLMECDDEAFNLHSSFSKRANNNEKGLETSPYFIDYSSKDDESSPLRPKRGLSSKGQTIGEAAKDLKK